jgi:ketosteroid isomerase-like protein
METLLLAVRPNDPATLAGGGADRGGRCGRKPDPCVPRHARGSACGTQRRVAISAPAKAVVAMHSYSTSTSSSCALSSAAMHGWSVATIPCIGLLWVAGATAAQSSPLEVGGGRLGTDGWGGVPAVLARIDPVVKVQRLEVQYRLENRPLGQSFQLQTAPRETSDAGFDAVLAAVEAAQVHLVNGQPGPFKALWSHGEDVTLTGGLGGAIARGWTQVSERLDWVATQYVGGVRTHQEVARYVGQDLAYVVLRETIRFKNLADGRAIVQELRVTQVFRREDGRWLIVHRHADSQVARSPAG